MSVRMAQMKNKLLNTACFGGKKWMLLAIRVNGEFTKNV